jgi:hypothetical protein
MRMRSKKFVEVLISQELSFLSETLTGTGKLTGKSGRLEAKSNLQRSNVSRPDHV